MTYKHQKKVNNFKLGLLCKLDKCIDAVLKKAADRNETKKVY